MSPQLSNLLVIATLVAVFWFLVIRPQQVRVRKQREMLAELAPGDEVITFSGIYGRVEQVADRIRLSTFDGSVIEVARQAVADIVTLSGATEEPEDADASA